MSILADIEKVLSDWEGASHQLHEAIRLKDYRSYRKSFSQGMRHFKSVKEFINANQNIHEDLKQHIISTVKLWTSTTEGLSRWKDEIGIELEDLKYKRKKKSKIRRGYASHRKTTGLNVSRKAK
ncbi:MAG: hypothetical protein MK132_00385 [Lentisphaerales bacterium]|nr:hypothetical protein [Lentisphaerales bacterium]